MASEFPNEPEQPTPQPVPPPSALPPQPAAGMIARIQRLLISPATEWPAIDAEPMHAKSLFLTWAVPLAAIGPIAGFLGLLLFVGSFLTTFGLIYAVAWYVLSLAATWGLALAIDGLAPNFGSTKNPDRAMKLACFSLTPFWIGTVLSVLPQLTWLGMLVGLYGVYLLWVGLPILTKAPADKAPAYVGIAALIAVVLMFAAHEIAGQIAARFLLSSVMGGFGGGFS